MSYIFSSNGNKYTFNKLDSMLISMPEKDGLHVLVRESKPDGTPKYSWTDAKIIVKVNHPFVFDYKPTDNTPLNTVRESFYLSKGSYLVTTRLSCYNENVPETWNGCNSYDDVAKYNYYIRVLIQADATHQRASQSEAESASTPSCVPYGSAACAAVLETKIVDTLSVVYNASDVCLMPTMLEGTYTITVETNMPKCVLLKDHKSISIAFEQLV